MHLLVMFIVFFSLTAAADGEESEYGLRIAPNLDYRHQSRWPVECQQKFRPYQSPIDLPLESNQLPSRMHVDFINFHVPIANYSFINDRGYRAMITPTDNVKRGVVVHDPDNLTEINEEFLLQQFHFHWDQGPSNGTSHAFNHIRYLTEMHVGLYKSSYGKDADKHVDGTLGIAVLFAETGVKNKEFEPIAKLGTRIVDENKAVYSSEPVNLLQLMPWKTTFNYYFGTTTFPFCGPTYWFTFNALLGLTAEQMSYRNWYYTSDSRRMRIVTTIRDIQPYNGRQVYRSRETNAVTIKGDLPELVSG